MIVDSLASVLVNGLLSGVITGAAAYAAIRVEIRYLRRDVDHAHRRLDALEGKK